MNGLALCAGIGGLELGVGLAVPGYRTVCYVEREAFAAALLAARMEDGTLDEAPVWSDLTTFDGRPWRGVVDIVTAGYPCQPFSLAGRRAGADDPRHLWPHVARIVTECAAPVVFLENVAGHLSLGGREVCSELLGMGYRVAGGVFSAAEVGAPHRRERLFLLAYRDIRQPHERQQRERVRHTAGDGGDLADSRCLSGDGVQPERQPWCRRAPAAGLEGGDVAHTDGQRRQQDPRGASRHEETHGGARRDQREPDGDYEPSGEGADVAHAAPRGRLGATQGASGHPPLGGQGVAIATGEQVGASGLAWGGAELGHAAGTRHEQTWCGQPDEPSGRGGMSGDGCCSVGDTDDTGPEGRCGSERGAAHELPAWPPSPSGDWSDIPAGLWPATPQPRVRGVADGRASRMDRLRALGNGVVPAVAAKAFRTLAVELGV